MSHRYFDLPCDEHDHIPGDRHREPGMLDSEWTGEIEAPVCPIDDVPMHGRDRDGWLICQVCLCSYNELAKAARS